MGRPGASSNERDDKRQSPVPAELLGALDSVWHANSDLASRFALTINKPRIEEHYGVWTIPVASGNDVGSGYDPSRALNTLREQVENAAHIPVTILLDH